MFVCCDCCVLSDRGLCDELITRAEESFRLWCVVVCDLETSWMRPWPTGNCRAKKQTVPLHHANASAWPRTTDSWLLFCSPLLDFRQWIFMKCTESECLTRTWSRWRNFFERWPWTSNRQTIK
jgi:hypothetical protein